MNTNTETEKTTKNLTRENAFTTVNSKQNLESFQTDYELSVPFAVRVNEKYYKLYKKFNASQKRLVKYLVEASIAAVAEGKGQIEFNETQPVIINLNANINEAKAEARASVEIDISKLVELVNELESLLIAIQKNNWDPQKHAYILPKARMTELSEKLSDLKKLVN